jgi:hypothetical protein
MPLQSSEQGSEQGSEGTPLLAGQTAGTPSENLSEEETSPPSSPESLFERETPADGALLGRIQQRNLSSDLFSGIRTAFNIVIVLSLRELQNPLLFLATLAGIIMTYGIIPLRHKPPSFDKLKQDLRLANFLLGELETKPQACSPQFRYDVTATREKLDELICERSHMYSQHYWRNYFGENYPILCLRWAQFILGSSMLQFAVPFVSRENPRSASNMSIASHILMALLMVASWTTTVMTSARRKLGQNLATVITELQNEPFRMAGLLAASEQLEPLALPEQAQITAILGTLTASFEEIFATAIVSSVTEEERGALTIKHTAWLESQRAKWTTAVSKIIEQKVAVANETIRGYVVGSAGKDLETTRQDIKATLDDISLLYGLDRQNLKQSMLASGVQFDGVNDYIDNISDDLLTQIKTKLKLYETTAQGKLESFNKFIPPRRAIIDRAITFKESEPAVSAEPTLRLEG